MSTSKNEETLEEIMRLIRQPAKDANQTQAEYLLNLVKLGLEMKNLEHARVENEKVEQRQQN